MTSLGRGELGLDYAPMTLRIITGPSVVDPSWILTRHLRGNEIKPTHIFTLRSCFIIALLGIISACGGYR